MRVSINHRQSRSALGKRHYFVDCSVVFSEEERAIIRDRQLGNYFFEVGSDIPTGKGIADFTFPNTALRMLSRFLVLSGIVAVVVHIAGGAPEWLPTLLFIGAFAVFAYRKSAERRSDRSFADQQITLGRLMSNPSFTVFASDSHSAQLAEHAIKDSLSQAKEILVTSAEPVRSKTFEL